MITINEKEYQAEVKGKYLFLSKSSLVINDSGVLVLVPYSSSILNGTLSIYS
jgi:hypothetical protein